MSSARSGEAARGRRAAVTRAAHDGALAPQGAGRTGQLVCLRCGSVVAFDDPELARTLRELAAAHGFALEVGSVDLRGTCWACQAPRAGGMH